MRFPRPEERKKYPSECSRCGGKIVERLVTLTYSQRGGGIRLVEGVPAGVCDLCHEQYLTVQASRAIDRLLTTPASKRQAVPVWRYKVLAPHD